MDNFDGAKKKAYEANQKAVVLVKNHEKLLPLAKSQKVCIVTFKGVDPALHRWHRPWVPVWATRTRMPLCARP